MKKRKSGSKEGKGGDSPSQLIDARIKELSDWRGETLARVRILIKQADPEVVEEWKWGGVPVWSHAGMICTGENVQECREDDTYRLESCQELIGRAWVEFWMAESGAQPGSDSVRPFAGRLPHLAHPCRIHRKTVNLHAGDGWEQPRLQLSCQ